MVDPAVRRSEAEPSWLRAALELAVLTALTEGSLHGYGLAQRLAEQGLGSIRGGVLYPVLNRLETEAAVCSNWQAGEGGPGRKVYAITEHGRRKLAEQRASWRRFAATFEQFLDQAVEGR